MTAKVCHGLAIRVIVAAFAAAISVSLPAAAQAPPSRVVSINLCTDQMAMLVAAPGQLQSVSFLATDRSSAMAEQARAYKPNHGLAEEIFLMQPDLVLAGTFSNPATVGLLRRLGLRVEQFAPDTSFDDIRTNYRRMGELLGQPARAAALVTQMDASLADLAARPGTGKTIAAWYANSYTVGKGALLDAVMSAAGLTNIATKVGMQGGGRLPLELLILSKPDLLTKGDNEYAAPALAQENFRHPAFRAVADQSRGVAVPGEYTICGTPFTAEAVKMLRDAAEAK